MAISAASSIAAPPKAEAGSSRDGRAPTHGRRICGTTNPTKPTAPATATPAPTAAAVPRISAQHFDIGQQMVAEGHRLRDLKVGEAGHGQ